MKEKGFSRDFMLVVIGQIISLFGNAAIRFILPLYLLNLTGSSALYGTVTACVLIPAVLLSPAGGLVADRVNKRNVMVALDFAAAAVILLFLLLMDGEHLIFFLTAALLLLYGIAGIYQPSVQASIPVLVKNGNIMAANSVVNTISSLASLAGPVLGGILYSVYGLKPVLAVCIACFLMSAVMEIFIRIPYQRQSSEGSVLKTVRKDFSESIRFLCREKPVIGKGMLVACGMNLYLSAMITVALPYLVTEVLNLERTQANRLYGFAEGILAAGGLAGGICAGIFSGRLHVRKAAVLLTACAGCVFPMGITLKMIPSGIINYIVITLCCFGIMFFSTVFTVQMMSFIQTETPQKLVGKVISVIITVAMCAQPAGNALYGILFEACRGYEYIVILFSGTVSVLIAVGAGKVFKRGFSQTGSTAG